LLKVGDSFHQLCLSLIFTIMFFVALSRMRTLIDNLPDLEQNKREFTRNKLVFITIFLNKALRFIIATGAFYANLYFTPNIEDDSDPMVTKLTTWIYMI
jgi:hypothetical protein